MYTYGPWYGSGIVAHATSQWRHTTHRAIEAFRKMIAAILKVWSRIRNPTPPIDAYSLEELSPYDFLVAVAATTWQLSYRKDDRAIRPIYGGPEKFRGSGLANGYFSRNL